MTRTICLFLCLLLTADCIPLQPQADEKHVTSGDECLLFPTEEVGLSLKKVRQNSANLVYFNLRIQGEEEELQHVSDSDTFFRLERDLGMFQPWSWQLCISRQGHSLLTLSDNYDVLSLSLLSIGVQHLDVTLTTSTAGCLDNMTSQAVYDKLLDLILADFKTKPSILADGKRSVDESVCYREMRRRSDDLAEFIHVCCHTEPELREDHLQAKRPVCSDVTPNPWISVLLVALLVVKVLVILFSPNLLPETFYREKYSTLKYIYHLPAGQTMTLRMLKTTSPWIHGNDERVVRLSKLPGMPQLREAIATWQMDRVHEVTVRHAQLAIKGRKLLGENYVPVGILKVLYDNLFLCRLRDLSPLTGCCDTTILGTLNPGISVPTWFKCARFLARAVLLMLLVLPWIIRLLIYYHYEEKAVAAKTTAAQRADLRLPFLGNFTVFLTPLHLVFVICYIILCVDACVYGLLSKAVKQKMRRVIRRCLRDMKERSKLSVCGWVISIVVLPCTTCGVLGLLITPIFLGLLLPILIPILAFYLFPAINLSVRLLLHILIFMCPAPVARVAGRLWLAISSRVNKIVSLDPLIEEESFEKKSSFSNCEVPFQILVVLMCLVSFWSVTFLLMELLSFAVELFVYTFIGLIVTADITGKYLCIIFFLLLYGSRCFSTIHKKYLQYHQLLQYEMVTMMRAEIDNLARSESMDQENTALRVQGTLAKPSSRPPLTLRVQDGCPRWETSSVLLFLDSQDSPYTPEKFFEETVNLNYCGCPGQLYTSFLQAVWSFLKIVFFLLFVFVAVMAFGSAYQVSSTNQLLATIAGCFIPFVFVHFFSRSSQAASVDPESIQFKTQLHAVINKYEQSWPVFDILPDDAKANKMMKPKQDEDETKIIGRNPLLDVPPLSSSTPYSTLTSSKPTSSNASEKTESEYWDDTTLDIIFDVSSSARAAQMQTGLGETEEGSQTMLNRTGESGAAGGNAGKSARKYRPTEASLHESDEVVDV